MKGRLGRFLRSSADSLLAPAEDPRRRFIDPAQQQHDLLLHVQSATVRLTETRERLEHQRLAIYQSAEQLDNEARLALIKNREDLARLALRRQRLCLTEIAKFDRQIQGIGSEEQQLAEIERQVIAQIEATRMRAEMAVARRSAAEAQVAAGEALSGIGTWAESTEHVERLERDAEDLQARADAIEELLGLGLLGQPIAQSDNSFTSGTSESASDAEIESRLAALKREQASLVR